MDTRRDFLQRALALAAAGATGPLWAAMKYDRNAVLKFFRDNAAMVRSRVKSGIESNRKGGVSLVFRDADGRLCENVHAAIRQKRHDFKYGANLFGLAETKNGAEAAAAYKERFAEAFNTATLPFYWKDVEPERGKTRYAKDSPYIYRRPPIDMCLEWCEANGVEPKAHCLNYVDHQPMWAKGSIESEKELLEKRFAELAARYADRIPMWEVTNETLFWTQGQLRRGSIFLAPDIVEWSFKTADRYFPRNRLVINESQINIMENGSYKLNRSAYYMQIENALAKGCRIDSVGIQAHATWGLNMRTVAAKARFQYNPPEMFGLLDTYAALGRPLQITECTIPAYSTDPADEAVQAEIVRKLYGIWFSHPAMEAIIYWDLTDAYSWCPEYFGSLCRKDMSPKPAYETIRELFGREWRTNLEREISGGRFSFRGFRGTYEVEATSGGRTVKREFRIGGSDAGTVEVSFPAKA